MATGSIITLLGKQIALNRTFKASPDYLAPTQFSVGTGTTTPAAGDSALVTPININGGQKKNFYAGYPVFDEANLQVTIRCILLTTEANTNSLTEFGIFNVDGTPKLYSRAVHTAITKNSSTQIIYIQKDRIIL